MMFRNRFLLLTAVAAVCFSATVLQAQSPIDRGVTITNGSSRRGGASSNRRSNLGSRLEALRNSTNETEAPLTQPNPRAVPSIPGPPPKALSNTRETYARPISSGAVNAGASSNVRVAGQTGGGIDHGQSIGGDSSRRIAAAPQREQTPVEGMLATSTAPMLRVDLVGPDSIVVGKPNNYVATIHNDGSKEAGNVMVSMVLPAWVKLSGVNSTAGEPQLQGAENGGQRIIWGVERIAARGKQQLALQLTPAESRAFDIALDWAFRPATSVSSITVLQPKLEMAILGPAEVSYGQTSVYTIRLANPGTGVAENVMLALQPLTVGQTPPQPRSIGSLAAGEVKELKIELAANQAGQMEIRAAASSGELKAESAHRVVIRRAHLTVAATGPQLKYARTTGAYQVSVTNDGDAPASGVVTQITLPAGSKYLGGTEGARQVGNGLMIPTGDLAAGDQRVYALQLQLNQEGANELNVKSTSQGELMGQAVAVTNVETIADLKLSMKDPQGPLPINTDVRYEVTILNRGTKAARDIRVVAQFSDGINPISTDGVTAQVTPGQAIFQPIAKLDPGQEITVRVTARANRPGIHVFRTELVCKDPESRQAAEDTTRFFGDGLGQTSTPTVQQFQPVQQQPSQQEFSPSQPLSQTQPKASVQIGEPVQPKASGDFQPANQSANDGPAFQAPQQAPQTSQVKQPGQLTIPEPPSFAIPPVKNQPAAKTASGGGGAFVPR